MFGFGKKRRKAQEVPLDLRRDGVEFSDLTTDESVDQAVAQGRLEWIHLVAPQFGGMDLPMNKVAGPTGAAAAKQHIDDQIVRVLDQGGTVKSSADIKYDDGPSRVPRSVHFDLGDAGEHTLTFW